MSKTQYIDQTPRVAVHPPKSILCVDADDEARLFAAELLYEYDVDFALTGDDAVQLAHSRAYDLYLVDPDVPGCERVDLVTDLRFYDKGVPLVICTGDGEWHGHAGKAEACLSKPFNAVELRALVESLLGTTA